MNKSSLYGFTQAELEAWLGERGHRKFHAMQVWESLYRKRVRDFSGMEEAGVKQEVVLLLEDSYAIGTLEEHTRQESVDGTVKFLFRLQDGNLIETVLMKHKFGLSVCVTTQVGCNIGCSFCASGLLAKSRDLTAGEIAEQIMRVQLFLDEAGEGKRVSHIVVMGIGEPFDNYTHLMNFLSIVQHAKGLAIGPRHITVSTSGLTAKIREFADSGAQVNLAVSLHAPNNELRTRIMKINKALPIEKLLESIDYYLERTRRRITLEYILLADVNDRRSEAQELAELVRSRPQLLKLANVNLIPYNPVDEHSQYKRSSQEAIVGFYDTLKKNGVSVSVRLEHGADIDAACGQLRSKQLRGGEGREPAAAGV
ncbi:23S rRNA (adenine(2503)-C(2))-methyltransferase RlmN [Paenibacillus pasadenensis]|uniref:23S rRNA (adenine(2503)-C(2))-methyltransferase RlmN n=1 Tax=Paenibacillus pasadenensis TaxID=217090 RepID=UPI002040865E|nr:23S rRNA (adenine(2503)-C(2))-methyltransferase RlmN [Paenibacillus pasadenensis]MCM3747793.1 23S rRNA (adenine(2503)-C(2))-methyltransferase RlmN [Paenibacillus pasadenensis]